MQPSTIEELEQEIHEASTKINCLQRKLDGMLHKRQVMLSETLEDKIEQCWKEASKEGSLWASPHELFTMAVDKMKERGIISE